MINLSLPTNEFSVCGHASSPETAAKALAVRPADIVVVDLSLRGGPILELTRVISRMCPSTRIVIFSAYENVFFVDRAFRAGASAYVTKREPPEALVNAIRAALAGRTYAKHELLVQLTQRLFDPKPKPSQGGIELLSYRELEFLRRVGAGEDSRTIADGLGITQKTIYAYRDRIRKKLGFTSSTEFAQAALRWARKREVT